METTGRLGLQGRILDNSPQTLPLLGEGWTELDGASSGSHHDITLVEGAPLVETNSPLRELSAKNSHPRAAANHRQLSSSSLMMKSFQSTVRENVPRAKYEHLHNIWVAEQRRDISPGAFGFQSVLRHVSLWLLELLITQLNRGLSES